MAVIFNSEHTSDQGRDYKVEIIDTDGGTLIDTFLVNSDGFRLEDTGKGRDLHQRIISKVCSFTIQVQNQDQEDWIVDLATSDEGRYIAKCYRDTTLIFTGVLICDTVQIDNAPKPYNFKLEAIDGVKLLKGVRLPDQVVGFRTLLSYLIAALKELPTASQYSTSDPFLETALNWWSAEHITEGQDSGDVLDKTYTINWTWGKKNNDNFIYYDCYTVIEAICTAFNCRLYYDEGVYVLEQIGLRTNASITRNRYDIDENALTSSTVNYDVDIDQSTNYHLAGGQISILPPLRSVEVAYEVDSGFNMLPPPTPLNQDRTVGLEEVGYVELGDEDVSLELSMDVLSVFGGNFQTSAQRDVVFYIYLKVGSKILDGTPANNSWVDAASNPNAHLLIGFQSGPELPTPNPSGDQNDIYLRVTTPPITEAGIVEIDMEASYWEWVSGTTYNKFSTPPAGVTHNWLVANGVLIPTTGEDQRITVLYGSSQTNGTERKEIFSLLGDGFTKDRPNVMSIKNASNEYVKTTGWKVGSGAGTYLKHGQLLAQTILSERLKPLRIYNGTIYFKTDIVTISNRVTYDGYDLIFNNGKCRTNFDEIQIQGIQVDVDTTGIVNSEIDEEPEIELPGFGDQTNGDPTGNEGNDPNDPPFQGQTGLITAEVLYEGDTITTFDIVEAEQDYFVTGDKIVVKDENTGYEQEFTLAAPINATDTTVTIESATITYQFPIFSPVLLSINDAQRRRDYQLYQNTTGSPVLSVAVTSFTLPDPASLSATEISKVLDVYRMGSKLIYNVGYTIDFANQEIDFMWELQDGEYVEMFKL